MRVPEKPVCIHPFRQNPVLTSLHWYVYPEEGMVLLEYWAMNSLCDVLEAHEDVLSTFNNRLWVAGPCLLCVI
jgi:hypothetical protein